MRFKEWLTEAQYLSFKQPISIQGVVADSIDFRFEDWGQGAQKMVLMPSARPFFSGPFSAPLSNNSYLNFHRGSPEWVSGTSPHKLAVLTNPDYSIEEKPAYRTLPKNWAEFASFYLRGALVKSPKINRETDIGLD